MDYQQTLTYLYSRLPMFSNLGASAIKKDLVNTIELCSRLGNPQTQFKTIHVAGTNGKGSVSHMLAAILQTAGFKTGLYTSPHLRDFRERIRLNGVMIPENEVIQFVENQKETIEEIEPSFFEVTVAMAFQYFATEKVDIAIIEVGLGGRLDSTNIITPLLSVITNIGYDHTNILGNTLSEIASEKAGIIKSGVPAIVGERQQEIENIFIDKAGSMGSNLVFASDEWSVLKSEQEKTANVLSFDALQLSDQSVISLNLDLTGSYQLKNIKTVLSSVNLIKKLGYTITDEHLQKSLKAVKSLTGLMGRWETIGTNPLIICDTGHNEHGIKEVMKNILATPYNTLHMVIGMVKDKDVTKVLSLLPATAKYYFCSPKIERAKPAGELANEAEIFHLHGEVFPTVKDAVEAAKKAAGENDLIFIGGSTFVVAEII
ncbi:folylpolyglutamate synthase/dihydrofolate synthase family protein [Pedobacter sp. P351]|uniref:bifunctional folylpolyglutamate synthase/dihydrofolate synthase n=1 Tax=Pedobacter superstes TaxID=3133441 RepID=UPI0030A801EA